MPAEEFVVNVKAFRRFTGHHTSPPVLPKQIGAALPASTKANLNCPLLPPVNCDCGETKLIEMAEKVSRLALQAAATHVVFNNNIEDQRQRSVVALLRLLHR